jgi:hypothetical protein
MKMDGTAPDEVRENGEPCWGHGGEPEPCERCANEKRWTQSAAARITAAAAEADKASREIRKAMADLKDYSLDFAESTEPGDMLDDLTAISRCLRNIRRMAVQYTGQGDR